MDLVKSRFILQQFLVQALKQKNLYLDSDVQFSSSIFQDCLRKLDRNNQISIISFWEHKLLLFYADEIAIISQTEDDMQTC